MEPEEYQRNLHEGLSGASSLMFHLLWLTVAVIVCVVILFEAWRCRGAIKDLLNVGLACAQKIPSPGLDHFRLLVKQKTVRRPLAIAGAGGTLMVGMTAGVLQLDGGWLTRNHRFWHRTPAQVEEWLSHWAILRPASASSDEYIFALIVAWSARHKSLVQGMQGDWTAVELRTAKGATKLQGRTIALHIDGNAYRFVNDDSTSTGKIVVDAKARRLDLVGKVITLYCSYRIEGNVLTLALWGSAADRQPAPSTDRGGMVFVFKRQPKEKAKDA